MARKLKTYVTSLGFFDLAIAAPSMKAALGACGWISISSTRDSKGKQRFSHRRRDHVETRRHSQAPGRIRRTFQGARRASHAPGGRQAQAQTDDRAYGGDGIDTPILNSGQGLRVNLNTGFIDANPANSGYGPYFQGVQAEYGLGPGPGYTPHAQGDPQDVTGVENVLGSKYDDALYGNALANNLAGGDGNDLLSGLDGNDVIGGGNGNDIIFGGIGTDTLTGGKDSDAFIWTNLTESKFTGGKPQDVITDFQQGSDHIDLSALGIAANEFLMHDNQNVDGINYSYAGIDANHNGQFDEGEFAIAVQVTSGTVLHNSDFVF